MTAIIYNHKTGEQRTLPMLQASHEVRANAGVWSFEPTPPRGWETQKPRYRLPIALKPAARDRMRHETPWTSYVDSGVNPSDPNRIETWQYADRELEAGCEITSTAWPHSSMKPLNYSAERVLEFLQKGMKSRMGVTPWVGGRLVLEDGMSFGVAEVNRRAEPTGHAA